MFNKPVPKYYKIYEELVQQIRSGKFQEGELFPSDTELVKQYNVSRGTIREAVKLLFQQGYLVREQGKGTFVTYRRIQQDPDQLMGFSELMRRNNMEPSARVIEKEIVQPGPNLMQSMQLQPDEQVVRVVRLRYGDDQPLIVERSFFNYELFEPLMDKDLENNSIFDLLYEHTDTRLGDATQRIEAVTSGQSELELLNVELGTPLLLIKRLIKTADGRYFQYSEDVYRSDRISFATQTSPYEQGRDDLGLSLDFSSVDWS